MVTVELDITQEDKARAERQAEKIGYSLSAYLAKLTVAHLPNHLESPSGTGLLEA
jgi:hypothetical protein